MDYNLKLDEVQNKIYRKRRIDSLLEQLYKQRVEADENERALRDIRAKEQADVDRLKGRSLAAFVYTLIGKKEEKLDRETAEAMAAAVKHDSAAAALASITEQIKALEAELHTLGNCERDYERLLADKTKQLKETNSETAGKIIEFEKEIGYVTSQLTEIDEAISAGKRALSVTEDVMNELDSAEGWGTWDLLGGGLVADLAKHSHLDDAQDKIDTLQSCLSSFQTEFADVEISADIQVKVDGFLRFADYFWDGLFADWSVLESIHSSQEEIKSVKSKLTQALDSLSELRKSAESREKACRDELDLLVLKA